MHHQAFSSDLWKKKERKNEGKKRVSDFPTRENIIVIYWKSNIKLLWNAFFSREREGREIILIPITWKFALFSPLIAYSTRINHRKIRYRVAKRSVEIFIISPIPVPMFVRVLLFFLFFFLQMNAIKQRAGKNWSGFRTPEFLSRVVASGNFHTRRVQWVR